MAKKKEAIEEPLEKQLWKTANKLRKNIDAEGADPEDREEEQLNALIKENLAKIKI